MCGRSWGARGEIDKDKPEPKEQNRTCTCHLPRLLTARSCALTHVHLVQGFEKLEEDPGQEAQQPQAWLRPHHDVRKAADNQHQAQAAAAPSTMTSIPARGQLPQPCRGCANCACGHMEGGWGKGFPCPCGLDVKPQHARANSDSGHFVCSLELSPHVRCDLAVQTGRCPCHKGNAAAPSPLCHHQGNESRRGEHSPVCTLPVFFPNTLRF